MRKLASNQTRAIDVFCCIMLYSRQRRNATYKWLDDKNAEKAAARSREPGSLPWRDNGRAERRF